MRSFTSSSENGYTQSKAFAIAAFFASGAVALTVLVGLTEWLIRAEVMPQDTGMAHFQLLTQANAPHAAFGDSHSARGFNATDGFVNLAFPAENIEDMKAKAVSYFAKREPGRVILQADPHLFAPYRVYSSRKIHRGPPKLYALSQRHRSRALGYWAAFLREGGNLKSTVTMTEYGSLLSEGDLSAIPERKRMLDAQLRRAQHSVVESAAVKKAREDYAALLDWLSERGAKLCLVSYPVSQDYADAMSNAGHEAEIDFFAKQASRIGARFVDARAAIVSHRLFRDIDHLSTLGAMAFSPRLLDACFRSVNVGRIQSRISSFSKPNLTSQN